MDQRRSHTLVMNADRTACTVYIPDDDPEADGGAVSEGTRQVQ